MRPAFSLRRLVGILAVPALYYGLLWATDPEAARHFTWFACWLAGIGLLLGWIAFVVWQGVRLVRSVRDDAAACAQDRIEVARQQAVREAISKAAAERRGGSAR